MLEAARRYCRTVANGLPRNFEFDDLVQEYVTAELEGRDGAKAVQEYVNSVDKHTKNTVSFQSMGFVPDEEIDLDMSETEQDEYLRVEDEIASEIREIQRKKLAELITQLERIHPDRAEAIRFLSTCDLDDEQGTVKAIMERFGCDFVAARYMWKDGIESLKELNNPSKRVDRPLWNETENVADLRKPHTKWKRAVRPMTDVILGEDAA